MGLTTECFSHFKLDIYIFFQVHVFGQFLSFPSYIIWNLCIWQAMEMMKLTRSPPWKNTGFQNYFEAFIENKSDYLLKEAEGEVGTLSQTLPYIIFLVSPIFIVLLIALQKRI